MGTTALAIGGLVAAGGVGVVIAAGCGGGSSDSANGHTPPPVAQTTPEPTPTPAPTPEPTPGPTYDVRGHWWIVAWGGPPGTDNEGPWRLVGETPSAGSQLNESGSVRWLWTVVGTTITYHSPYNPVACPDWGGTVMSADLMQGVGITCYEHHSFNWRAARLATQ